MNDDDTDTQERVLPLKPVPYVRAPVTGRPETEGLWPRLADPYRAAANPDHQEISRLVVVMGKDGFKPGGVAYHLFQYVHLGLGEFGFTADGEQRCRFVFADRQPKWLTLKGSGILRVCDYISLRRMPWIRLADRNFRADTDGEGDSPIFTGIEISDWEPEEGVAHTAE